jgi:hypothetical protein
MRSLELTAACRSCAALCCVTTSFAASEDFAFDKPAGTPCPHLEPDGRCAVHDERRVRGMSGCVAFDCHGAGQRLTHATHDDDVRHALFVALCRVHELLWLLTGARHLCPPTQATLRERIAAAIATLQAIDVQHAVDVDLRPGHALLREVGVALGGRRRALPILP